MALCMFPDHKDQKNEDRPDLFLMETLYRAGDEPEFRACRRFLHRTGRIPPVPSTLLLEKPARDSSDHLIAWEYLHGDSACRRVETEIACDIPWDLCLDRPGQIALRGFEEPHTKGFCRLQLPETLRQICYEDCRQESVAMTQQLETTSPRFHS